MTRNADLPGHEPMMFELLSGQLVWRGGKERGAQNADAFVGWPTAGGGEAGREKARCDFLIGEASCHAAHGGRAFDRLAAGISIDRLFEQLLQSSAHQRNHMLRTTLLLARLGRSKCMLMTCH